MEKKDRMPKTPKNKYANFFWLMLAFGVIVLDQFSKFIIGTYLFPEQCVYINQSFNICYVYNTGAAFSLLANATGWQEWIFGSLAFLVSVGIIYWLYKESKKLFVSSKIALMLILGGALGNLIDRVMYQYVRDFLDFHWQIHHWPVFNFADIAICIGAFMLVFEILRMRK